VQFLGVDIQDTEEKASAYLHEFDISYPNGMDEDGRVTIDYGVVGIPVTFFVYRNGVIERRWVGAVKEKQLTTWIDELIAGATPSGDIEGENLESFFELQ